MYLLSFAYATGPIVVPAAVGGAIAANLNILADHDFQCNYITASVIQAGVLVANWAGTIQIEDSAVGRTMFNAAIPLHSVAGSGELPYPFNPPRLFRRNSSVVITLTNNVVTATTVHIVFHGNKLLPSQDDSQ